jgi:hypothetical protein
LSKIIGPQSYILLKLSKKTLCLILATWSGGVVEWWKKIQYSSTPTLYYSALYQATSLFSPAIPTDPDLFWTPICRA